MKSWSWAVVFLGMAFSAGCSEDKSSADTIYLGGEILTMDGDQPSYVEAVAVRDGRILFVGTKARALERKGAGTDIVDLAGKAMLPGFIDPHGHFMSAVRMVEQVNVASPPMGEVTDIPSIIEQLKAFQKESKIPKGGWIVGWGYDQDLLKEQRHLTREDLDPFFPNHKVMVVHVSMHGAVLNSKALAWAGIDAKTPTPAGGIIARLDGSPEPAGLLMETAFLPVFGKMPQPSQQAMLQDLVRPAQMMYASNGYTHAVEGFSHVRDLDFLKRAAKEGKLFIDVVALPGFPEIDQWLDNPEYRFGAYENRFKIHAGKFTLDGSPQGKTAFVTVPYKTGGPSGQKNWKGETSIPKKDLFRMVKQLADRKIPIQIHANGDAAIDESIEAIRAAGIKAGDDRRPVIVHSQFQRPDQLDLYVDLGISPSFFTNHCFYWGDVHVRNLGEEKASFISPIKAATDKGLVCSNHTDFNVTLLDPFFVLWTAMARETRSGKILGPDQRVDAYTALKALTTAPAWQFFEEDRKGMIKEGLLADFVILSHDPVQTGVDEIREIEVLETIKEDDTIFQASTEASKSEEAGPLTVFVAKKIITMEPALPEATAVAVADGRIVSVGNLESLKGWIDARGATIDRSLEDKILMPGFIDPHVHPSLPAVLTQFPFLAPDDWSLPTGEFPGATTPQAYVARLEELVAAHFADPGHDPKVPFITWGYHQLWHGDIYRKELNELFQDKPVMLWQRSFHELIGNDAAFDLLGVTESDVRGQDGVDWEKGHFSENGAMILLPKMAFLFDPDRYAKGMGNFLEMMHQSGVTTALDMGIGIFGDPVGETALIRQVAEETGAPARIILTPIITDFLARGVSIPDALEQVDEWRKGNTRRVMYDRRFKIMMDGAIYSGASQVGFPGYMDGHQGIWMAPLEVTTEWAQAFWNAGYQIHAHTNGDKSAAAMIEILRKLLDEKPRTDHRFSLEHFAYTTEDQNRQLKALGVVVSANPYYQYILSDIYSEKWLGEDRGRQMVRLGSLERLGLPFALHSDAPMGPLNPLMLAWTAVNRVTINGNRNAPEERISVDAALRAITTNAAWIMGWEDEIGSIRAGKKADFVVLEQDPYQVDPMALKDVPIWGTVFEGEVFPVEQKR